MLSPHQRCARGVERETRATVAGVGDLDRRGLILHHATIRRPNHRRVLPGDLALVELRQWLRCLRLYLPLEEKLGGPLLFTSVARGPKSVERQLERFKAKDTIVLLVNRLELGGFLVSSVGEVALARDRFHEGLAFSSQALKVEVVHEASLRAR